VGARRLLALRAELAAALLVVQRLRPLKWPHSHAPHTYPPLARLFALCSKLNVPLDKLLLFWQGKELTHEHDSRTLLDLNLHTGFSLQVGGCAQGCPDRMVTFR
jgi:hypothetical protein